MANGSAVETSHSVCSLLKLRKKCAQVNCSAGTQKRTALGVDRRMSPCLFACGISGVKSNPDHSLAAWVCNTKTRSSSSAKKHTRLCVSRIARAQIGKPRARYRFCNACIQHRIHCVCTFHWERTLHTLLVLSEREHMDTPGRHGPCSNIEHLLNQVWTRRPHKNY